MLRVKTTILLLGGVFASAGVARAQQFHLQETTIDDIHRAIRNGQITCKELVQLYLGFPSLRDALEKA